MVGKLIHKWRNIRRQGVLGDQLEVGAHTTVDYSRLKIVGDSSIKIGASCLINGSLSCERTAATIHVGKETFIGNSSIVAAKSIKIGNYVLISSGCYITDTNGHAMNYLIRQKDVSNRLQGFKDWDAVESEPMILEDHCWIGYGAIILMGVRIGKGAVIGAGSVVTMDVPDFVVCAGNPAKILRSLA